MRVAIDVSEGVTVLLSIDKIAELVKEKYGQRTEAIAVSESHDWLKTQSKSAWKPEEDAELVKFLKEEGASLKTYHEVAKKLGRTFEAIRTRVSHLRIKAITDDEGVVRSPRISKQFKPTKRKRQNKSWKISEDEKLKKFFKQYGHNKQSRKAISEILDRTEASIRTRLVVLKKKGQEPSTVDYKKKVLVFNGDKNIARDVKNCKHCKKDFERQKGHTDYIWNKMRFCSSGCRALYHNQNKAVSPKSNWKNRKWTKTEDDVLKQEVKAGGKTLYNYGRIGKLINRSSGAVLQRIHTQKNKSFEEARAKSIIADDLEKKGD